VGEIYRPPNLSHTLFMDYLEKILDSLENTKCTCVIAGDFNYNLLKYHSDKPTLSFMNMLNSYGFFPTISKATRISNNSDALLDNIFINDVNVVNNSGILLHDLSDHFPVFLNLSLIQSTTITRHSVTVFDKN